MLVLLGHILRIAGLEDSQVVPDWSTTEVSWQLECCGESLQKASKQGSQDGDGSKRKRQAHLPGMQLLRCKTLFKHCAALGLAPQGGTGPIKASQEQTDCICTQSVKDEKSSIKFSNHMCTWDQPSCQLNNLSISKIIKYLNFKPFYKPGSICFSSKQTL